MGGGRGQERDWIQEGYKTRRRLQKTQAATPGPILQGATLKILGEHLV